MERTIEVIQQKNKKKVTIFGDLTYRIAMMQIDAEEIKKELMKINQEAAALPKPELKVVEPEVVQ